MHGLSLNVLKAFNGVMSLNLHIVLNRLFPLGGCIEDLRRFCGISTISRIGVRKNGFLTLHATVFQLYM